MDVKYFISKGIWVSKMKKCGKEYNVREVFFSFILFNLQKYLYFTAFLRRLREGNIMFSVVSVCLTISQCICSHLQEGGCPSTERPSSTFSISYVFELKCQSEELTVYFNRYVQFNIQNMRLWCHIYVCTYVIFLPDIVHQHKSWFEVSIGQIYKKINTI